MARRELIGRRRSGRAASCAAAVALAGLVSCAHPADPTLDGASVTAGLPAAIWPADPGAVTGVECPDLDPEVVAQTTTCHVRIGADRVAVDVAVDTTGSVTVDVGVALFDVAAAGRAVATRWRDDAGVDDMPSVDCERAVVVARAGVSVPCRATRDGLAVDFAVRLVDGRGGWELDELR
ncbi:MAG: hypothetical protein R2695_01035 [Acidimicrobiales bacterium]